MTNKLVSLNHANLRHAEANQFLTRFLDDLDKSGLDLLTDDVVTGLVAAFATYQDLADYTAVLARVKGDQFYLDMLAVLNNSRAYYADLLARR